MFVHLSFFSRWYFSHNFQRTTFTILSCLCLYYLWANFSVTLKDNMVHTLSPLSPHYLHKGDPRGLNMVSVTWLVKRAWPAQISASVCIFKSAFRNQLQVSLACVVSGIPLKNWPCSSFSFQLWSVSSLFQDVFIHLYWQFPHFQFHQ